MKSLRVVTLILQMISSSVRILLHCVWLLITWLHYNTFSFEKRHTSLRFKIQIHTFYIFLVRCYLFIYYFARKRVCNVMVPDNWLLTYGCVKFMQYRALYKKLYDKHLRWTNGLYVEFVVNRTGTKKWNLNRERS